MKAHTPIDQLIGALDNGLRVVFSKPNAKRPSPAVDTENSYKLDEQRANHSAALMRVNHVGEVCAQALYQGQALTSRSEEVRQKMKVAADEELDHLRWCADRIDELNGQTSIFNPLWYSASFALGVGAGLAGDRWSLGFLAETERQVVDHLRSHLTRIAEDDVKSRQIIEQMVEDEALHAEMAVDNGAAELPDWIKHAMRSTARVMTTVSEKL